jgi:predicted esterase
MAKRLERSKHRPGTQKSYCVDDMEYYVYYPRGNPPPGGWPILLFMHGRGEARSTYSEARGWVAQRLSAVKRHGSPPALCGKRTRVAELANSFIVVSPQFPFVPNEHQRLTKITPWQWADHASTITRMLDTVITNFDANANKEYATGFSRGARGALAIARQIKRHRIRKLVLVDSESSPVPTPAPTWVHFAGARTFPGIIAGHSGLVEQRGQGRWEIDRRRGPVPSGNYVFTNWQLRSAEETKNHTETCRLAYKNARTYKWLLARNWKRTKTRKTQNRKVSSTPEQTNRMERRVRTPSSQRLES